MNSDRKQQITSIFHSAIEREGTERRAFLDGACANDAELRNEVDQLIAAHAKAGSFIDQPEYASGAGLLNDGDGRAFEGRTIGPYKVVSLLGAGGMGEVYRAHDSRLGREVALKILPSSLAGGDESVRRFQQEARAASALNHPNILSIFDTGTTDDGMPFVVSELLEGETLREKLAGGALQLRKAIDYALQTARGLAAAHGKGIVHRDLKPENLFVTRDGRVKILDFGIAKLVQRQGLGHELHTEAPTMIVKTNPGMVIGTVGYMSPEQVRGESVDTRSDIFSFGAILYEMLSGRRAFQGDSHVETMNAILKEEPPDLTANNSKISPAVERVVRRCLEKQPEERFQSASDLAFAVESLSSFQSSGATATVETSEDAKPAHRTKLRERLSWVVGAVFLVATLAFAAVYFRRVESRAETMRFALPAPPKTSYRDSLALSPDGRRLAFVATTTDGLTSLWVRALDSVSARQLPGTEGAAFPFWSPDSRFIGFFASNKLKKIDASGGPAQALAEASVDARGATWGTDGTILFTPNYAVPLSRVPASGGVTTPATELDTSRGQTSHRWPFFLPDGRHFLYFARANQKEAEGVYVGSLDSKEGKLLLNSSVRAAYAPATPGGAGGYLLFMRDETLVAQPFDALTLKLSGEPAVVAEGVLTYPTEGDATAYGAFSASANGHLSYLSGNELTTQLGWFNRAGNPVGLVGASGIYTEPSLSPDGKRISLGRSESHAEDIWLLDIARDTMTRFTFDPATDICAAWSPDGSQVAFASNRSGKHQLYQKSASGAGTDELLLQTDYNAFPDDWMMMKDGRQFILYETENPKTRYDLYVLLLSGERKPFPFLQTEFNEAHAQFSPDGRWVAYVSDASGRAEVYVQSFPASGGKWQISTGGGDQPEWRSDGKELFYLSPDKKIMAVPITAGASFEAGAPAALFTTHVKLTSLTNQRNNYVVAADGQRFLVNNLVEEGNTQPITLVLNWAAGLKQ
jgi:eukaryotic-like serine/threonine-protein kinase